MFNKKPAVPGDVPQSAHADFIKRYTTITKGTGRLFLFAADQKMEHLNDDFYGEGIDSAALDPQHIFTIAEHGTIGALATHVGLIARYGSMYTHINYIAKLNGKTNLVSDKETDPMSTMLWDVDDAVNVAQNMNIPLCGVGYTIYLGSMYEHEMLAQAAQIVMKAHEQGLIAILWVYPRARHIQKQNTPALVAGAAGIAQTLGADFVKVHVPETGSKEDMQALAIAVQAAGNTQLICSGGSRIDAVELIKNVADQLSLGHAAGCAVGRNIFQRSYKEALALTAALAAMVYDGVTVQQAIDMFKKQA